MSLSQKHFNELAKLLVDYQHDCAEYNVPLTEYQRKELITRVIVFCKRHNPKFRADYFREKSTYI